MNVRRNAKLYERRSHFQLHTTVRVKFRGLATLYFAARRVGHKRGNILLAQQWVSTCNATMLRDKLKKNVARITGP